MNIQALVVLCLTIFHNILSESSNIANSSKHRIHSRLFHERKKWKKNDIRALNSRHFVQRYNHNISINIESHGGNIDSNYDKNTGNKENLVSRKAKPCPTCINQFKVVNKGVNRSVGVLNPRYSYLSASTSDGYRRLRRSSEEDVEEEDTNTDNNRNSEPVDSERTSKNLEKSTEYTEEEKVEALAYLDYLNIHIPANCTDSNNTISKHSAIPVTVRPVFRQVNNVIVLTKLLSALTKQSNIQSNDVTKYDAIYYATIRALVASDDVIYSGEIRFSADRTGSNRQRPHSVYAHRNRTTKKIHTTNRGNDKISSSAQEDSDWFRYLQDLELDDEQVSRICSPTDQDSGPPSQRFRGTGAPERWSMPYFPCHKPGPSTWLLSYSRPFYTCSPAGQATFRGAVRVEIDLSRLDIDQCDQTGTVFSNTHKCRPTTKCSFQPNHGFRRGGYSCNCSDGFYFPPPYSTFPPSPSHSITTSRDDVRRRYFRGIDVENRFNGASSDVITMAEVNALLREDDNMMCLPCSGLDCPECSSNEWCQARDRSVSLTRLIPLCIESFCLLASLIIAIVIARLRHTKIMKASFWILLEIIIIGALLLYTTLILQYLEATRLTCLVVPWFREIGFFIVYGALLVNVYRVLAEFQSRKAQRVLLRDKDLLRYLAVIVGLVIAYMIAWTVGTSDVMFNYGRTVVESRGKTSRDQQESMTSSFSASICTYTLWHYVTDLGELLFLCLGLYLCHCVRTSPSYYLDTRYITWALINEISVSILFHIVRFAVWSLVDSDILFLLYFIRSQMTTTITLALVIGTKVWYTQRPPDGLSARRRAAYSAAETQDPLESTKLNLWPTGGAPNPDPETTDNSSLDLNHEDIKMELKRLYIQIQLYKSRAAAARKDTSMRSSKRRVISRKHTSSHRRFSLQTLQGKMKPPVTGDGASSCGNASPGIDQGTSEPPLNPDTNPRKSEDNSPTVIVGEKGSLVTSELS